VKVQARMSCCATRKQLSWMVRVQSKARVLTKRRHPMRARGTIKALQRQGKKEIRTQNKTRRPKTEAQSPQVLRSTRRPIRPRLLQMLDTLDLIRTGHTMRMCPRQKKLISALRTKMSSLLRKLRKCRKKNAPQKREQRGLSGWKSRASVHIAMMVC
jgi:hypothetical protein